MNEMMHIECRNCGRQIAAADINIERLIAKCGACHAVFGFDLQGGSPPRRQRSKVAMPKSVAVDNQGGELVIVHRWRSVVAVVFLSIFALVWNGISWTFFLAMLSEAPWYVAAFLSVFLLVGAVVGYLALAMMLNSSEIRVAARRLTVKHGPLPFPGGVDVHSDDIEQLWVEQKISHSNSSRGSSTSVTYPVCMRMKNGTRKHLLRNVQDSELALFVEQEIEAFLGIEDREMPGEL